MERKYKALVFALADALYVATTQLSTDFIYFCEKLPNSQVGMEICKETRLSLFINGPCVECGTSYAICSTCKVRSKNRLETYDFQCWHCGNRLFICKKCTTDDTVSKYTCSVCAYDYCTQCKKQHEPTCGQ